MTTIKFDTYEEARAAFRACLPAASSAIRSFGIEEITTADGMVIRFRTRTGS